MVPENFTNNFEFRLENKFRAVGLLILAMIWKDRIIVLGEIKEEKCSCEKEAVLASMGIVEENINKLINNP